MVGQSSTMTDSPGTGMDKLNHTLVDVTLMTSRNVTYGPYSSEYFQKLSDEELRNYIYQHRLPGQPSSVAAVSIISLAVLVFICSSLILLATRYTSGGQSATLVFLRSLLLSDILMSIYGMTKMAMLINLQKLQVNFFLPESLFFTASLASTASLLSLNLDCFLKLTRPLKYAQVDKHTVITVMLFIWNGAFVVGFLPLVGWYDEAYTFRFFSFFPWHFLLFNALVVLICALVCIGCMVTLKRYHTAGPDPGDPPGPAYFSTRSLEVRKYRHLHRTILVESCMWLAAYLPFFIYISVTCRQCLAGEYAYSDSGILYFIPVFLVKSMFSAGLQAFRTIHVHAIMNKLITDISNIASPPENRKHRNRDKCKDAVSTIAYTNPLCEHHHEEHGFQQYLPDGGNDVADASSSDDGYYRVPYAHHHDNNGGQAGEHNKQRKKKAGGGHRMQRSNPTLHQSRTLLLGHDRWLKHQRVLHDTELTDFTSALSEHETLSGDGSGSIITGIANLAFRPSIDIGVESCTKL